MADIQHKIILLPQARLLGLKRYFTGKPCKHGHVAERRVNSGDCYECKLNNDKKRIAANPQAEADRRRANRNAHLDDYNAKVRKWRAENPERIKKYARTSKEKNPEKHREQSYRKTLKWKVKNPDRVKEINRRGNIRSRAKRKCAPGNHTQADIVAIIRMQKNKCAYCRKRLPKIYHVDHIFPLSKGGSNDKRNVQVTCPRCNLDKRAKDPIDYARSQGMLL